MLYSSSSSKDAESAVLAKIQRIGSVVIKKIASKNLPKFEDVLLQSDNSESNGNNWEAESFEEDYENKNDSDSDYNDLIEEESDFDYSPVISKSTSISKVEKKKPPKEIILNAPTTYTCSNCHDSFTTYDTLFLHMKSNICLMEKLVCEICSKAFNTKKKFNAHKVHHKPKETFMCEECSQIFQSKFNLDFHIQSVHNRKILFSEAIFTCSLCTESDTKFHSHADLSKHVKEHKMEKMVSIFFLSINSSYELILF